MSKKSTVFQIKAMHFSAAFFLAWKARDYLKNHPDAAVVNLGCEPDSTGRSYDNGNCKIYNPDFSDVIAVRSELPAGEWEKNIHAI